MSPWADEPHTATWPTRPWFKSIGAVLVPLIIFVAFPLTGCRAPAAARDPRAQMKDALAKTSIQKTSPAEKLENTLEGIQGALARAKRKVKARKNASSDLKALAGFAADLGRIDSEVKAEFEKTREVLAKIKSRDKDAIQARVEKEYAAKMRHLKSALASITDPAPGTSTTTRDGQLSAMSALSSWVDSMTPEPPHQPLGTELPHRIVDYKAGPPTLGTAIAPAYAPNTPGAVPSTLPVTPTAEDLTQTVEVQFTKDISATANELGRDPVKMYEFVRNTMDYEPYYGSRKGANETLWERAGNDFDQASLLIALYRYSGIPARYVYGVVEIPVDKAMNWVGVEAPEAAARLFSSAGVPSKALTSGGKIVKLQIEHCWVEAYVPYESYRGVPAGPGAAKRQWVALDPSWKQLIRRREVSLPDVSEIASRLAGKVFSSVQCDDRGTIVGADVASIESTFTALASEVPTQGPSGPLLAALRPLAIRAERFACLPHAIVPRAVGVQGEYRFLPPGLRTEFSVTTNDLRFTAPTASLAGRLLTLGYSAATTEDAVLVSRYGSVEEIPAYLLTVRPVLRLDGAVVGEGEELQAGSIHAFEVMTTGSPPVANWATAGSLYSLNVQTGDGSAKEVDQHFSELQEQLTNLGGDSGSSRETFSPDILLGETLNIPAKAYFLQYGAAAKLVSRATRVRAFRETALSRTGYATDVANLWGTPSTIHLSGFFIDIDQDPLILGISSQQVTDARRLQRVLGWVGSALEGAIWDQLCPGGFDTWSTGDAVVAALEGGTSLMPLEPCDAPQVTQLLDLPEEIEERIEAELANGRRVLATQRTIPREGWSGLGYLVDDEVGGHQSYEIASNVGGGEGHNYSPTPAGLFIIGGTLLATALIIACPAVFMGAAGIAAVVLATAPYIAIYATAMGAYKTVLESKMSQRHKDYFMNQIARELTVMLAATVMFEVFMAMSVGSGFAHAWAVAMIGQAITACMFAYYYDVLLPIQVASLEHWDSELPGGWDEP